MADGADEGCRIEPPYTRYSRSERIADGIAHVAGLLFAVTAIAYLSRLSRGQPAGAAIGLTLYGIGLLSMLGFSALYNFSRPGRAKATLRRLDHAAIFFMIAGTYSPFALIALRGALGDVLLAAIWTVAATGALIKVVMPGRFERTFVAMYLLLGWSGLAAIHSLLGAIPSASLMLLGAGGLLYSLGVVFHLAARVPYQNAIWHVFVLGAAICHFLAVCIVAQGPHLSS